MSKPYNFVPSLDPKFYPHIGRLIVLWAFLEIQIDQHIIGLLTRPETKQHRLGRRLDATLPRAFKRRLRLWKQLARIHYQDNSLARIRSIISRCSAIRKDRDRIAHGRWAVGLGESEEPIAYSYLARNGLIPDDGYPLSTAEISAASHEIADLIREVFWFERDHYPSLRPPKPLSKFFRQE